MTMAMKRFLWMRVRLFRRLLLQGKTGDVPFEMYTTMTDCVSTMAGTYRKWPNMARDSIKAVNDKLSPTISRTRVRWAMSIFNWNGNAIRDSYDRLDASSNPARDSLVLYLALLIVQLVEQFAHAGRIAGRVVGPADIVGGRRCPGSVLPLALGAAPADGKLCGRTDE